MGRFRRLDLMTLMGLALVGLSAGIVSGLSVEQKTYTVHELKAHWSTPYDLVVLPKGTKAVLGSLADPNALDEGTGGITVAQWKKIERLPGVSVAAPLAPVGQTYLGLQVGLIKPGVPGLFRITETFQGRGLPSATSPYVLYYMGPTSGFGWRPPVWGSVVAVDASAENRLVGLKGAVTHGVYFGPDTATLVPASKNVPPALVDVPALVTSSPPVFASDTLTVQLLKSHYSTTKASKYAYEADMHPTLPTPLSALTGSMVFHTTFTDNSLWKIWIDEQTGEPTPRSLGALTISNQNDRPWGESFGGPLLKVGSVSYSRVHSPFPGRWPVALKADPVPCKGVDPTGCGSFVFTGEEFRTLTLQHGLSFGFHVVGEYSPSKLHISVDPLTGVPMVNYAPEEGKVVLSPSGKAVNPPQVAVPDMQPAGLFTQPPIMLVPIKDVLPILSKAPLSSIRIKVSGTGHFSTSSQSTLEAMAARIRKATGLQVEIIRGASPQQVLVHPGNENGYTKVGWIQEAWVKTGAAVEILRQTLLSQDVILLPILVGAFVFALTAGIIGVEVRRKDYATLLALGVAPRSVQVSVVGEGLLYGAVVAALTLVAAIAVAGIRAVGVGMPVALLSGLVISAALVPVARATGRMEPLASLRESLPGLSRAVAPSTVVGMGLTLFLSSVRRQIAAISALLIPGAVFYLIFLVQGSLHHTMYLTSLGQYLLVRVGPLVTLGTVVVVALAILTSAQVGLRNATLRAKTWAIGSAVGWPISVPILASLVEAGAVGLAAGLIGATVAALVGDLLLGVAFQPQIWGEAIGVIVVSGLFAALPSAIIIARQEPISHLRGAGT
ncbi:MAG: hypothetical protein M0Z66_02830 [Thermaerobacter sp.]|nr:hypothetical protein [Thermaerobacter sp.]